jgi:hypothetical protein
VKPGETVYHHNDKCKDGEKIESYYMKAGRADRPLCKICLRLYIDQR